MAKRPILLALVAVATVAVVIPMTAFGLPYGRFNPEDFTHLYTEPDNLNETHLHIDADPYNGTRPCDPIDSTRTVLVGDQYDVALCLETYAPNNVESFNLLINHNSAINQAADPDGPGFGDNPLAEEPPNTFGEGGLDMFAANCADSVDNDSDTLVDAADPECAFPAGNLDDNPNANDGDDEANGLTLGLGWDCTGFGVAPPKGSGGAAGAGPIRLACAGIFDQDLTADPGLLATIAFTATGTGDEFLSWDPGTQVGGDDVVLPNGGFARCSSEIPGEHIPCFGATINKADCLWEDPLRGTSMILQGDEWKVMFDSQTVGGTDIVLRAGDRALVVFRAPGFFGFGFGTCPSGPAMVIAVNLFPLQLVRVIDVMGDLVNGE